MGPREGEPTGEPIVLDPAPVEADRLLSALLRSVHVTRETTESHHLHQLVDLNDHRSTETHYRAGMQCPWCGGEMTERDGTFVCSATGLDMSRKASEELRDVVASVPDRSVAEPGTIRWGGSWHCPADGALMIEAEGVVKCPDCRRALPGRLLYHLIEFHVHP
jgi:hypothetical protein